ncbi:alpha/beta fold hydrolase [Actinacidiphila sp. bgisy167]|uniref:alpha/beta fold hydrolase n=1 Tax=Actinacidiphila sp. bgisy167 TaxID=3413797 RepID=UPI003D714F93
MRDGTRTDVRRADGGVTAVEVVGEPDAPAVLYCHGLADSRLSAYDVAGAARALGLRVIAPDRPGTGGTDARRLRRVADWAEEAALVMDALDVGTVALLGVSGGGAFAAACASLLPDRVRGLLLVAPLGPPSWTTRGMTGGQRVSLAIARHAPAFGGWFLGRLAVPARRAPGLFVRLATSGMPAVDRRALAGPQARASLLANYVRAFERGSGGVGQDLRVLTRPWGFDLQSVDVPTWIHHGDADTTVPLAHARRFAEAIPDARLHIHPGEGHFSILAAPERMLADLAA